MAAVTKLKPIDFEFEQNSLPTAEVAFSDGFTVVIRYIPEPKERQIQAKCAGDVEKLLEERGKARIVGWSGLTPLAFVDVCPDVETPEPDEETGEIACNVHLKGQLYRYSSGIEFRLPIEEAAAELAKQYKAKKKQGLKS